MPSPLQRGACAWGRARVAAAAGTIACAIACYAVPESALAQSPTWEVAGAVGAGFRAERGHTLGGARLEGALRRVPTVAGMSGTTLAFGAAIAQITAHQGPTGDGPNIKENSAELFVRAERALFSGTAWRVDGSLAPVLSISMGCSAGGSFAGDQVGYGDAQCTNAFAKKANVRPGASARLTASARGPRVSAIGGVDATVGTVAAGNTVALSVFVGFRAPLSSR
ncbi:MAG: hypothetical protein U9Q74_03890 [Gemmatimonadota bacterium]|nr:hypothetical protein [Gemmatimonadota bacterium]